ncbi:craniofacial development protein 2 [Biomphalaria glabrata]
MLRCSERSRSCTVALQLYCVQQCALNWETMAMFPYFTFGFALPEEVFCPILEYPNEEDRHDGIGCGSLPPTKVAPGTLVSDVVN